MPDLRSELSKVINEWEALQPAQETQMPPKFFTTTNNVTRATFEHIKNNPGVSRSAAIRALTLEGYKPSSTSSILAQMVKQGLMRGDSDALFTVAPEYRPLKSGVARRALSPNKVGRPRKQRASQPEHSTPEPLPSGAKFTATTAQLLDTLSIVQARELYDELKKIFGG